MDFGLYIYFEKSIICEIYQTYILEKCMSIRLLAHITDVRSPLHFTLHSQILRITLHKESEYMPESCQSYHSGMCSHFINMRDQRVVGKRRWTLGKIDSKKWRVYSVYFLVKSSTYLCKILVIYFIKKAFMEKHAWKENNNFSNQLFVIITSHYNDEDKKLISKLSVILFSCMFFHK